MWRVPVAWSSCACSGSAAPAQAKTVNAGIGEFFFRADRVRVDPGDTVTWTNRGDVLHNVTSRRGAPERFASADLESGQAFSRVFAKAGTYDYLCTIHPFQMSGSVQVGPDRVKPKVTGRSGQLAQAPPRACPRCPSGPR